MSEAIEAAETILLPVKDEMSQELAFDDVITPVSRGSFIAEFWNKSFLHLPGQAGRFQSLLTWDELNSILEQDWLKQPVLRLFQDGSPVVESRYMKQVGTGSRLDAGGLTACLSQGATLIVSYIGDLAPRIRGLAESCEEALQAHTNANLYAGFRSQKGFDLHWDTHDTMMLQLAGRKRWKVYRPTRLHPLTDDVAVAPKPTEEPIWDGILEDGDMIYIPRGWWHIAYPLDEPSLHLTFGFETLTGVTFLNWLVGKLRGHPEVRMEVPRLGDEATRKQYVAGLRRLLTDAWNDEILTSFLRDWDSRRYIRPRTGLPFAPARQNAPLTMETRIRLAGKYCLSFERDVGGEIAHFDASGRQWVCSVELIPALETLSGKHSLSVQELCAKLPSEGARVKLRVLLTALAMTGAILKEASDT